MNTSASFVLCCLRHRTSLDVGRQIALINECDPIGLRTYSEPLHVRSLKLFSLLLLVCEHGRQRLVFDLIQI